MKTGNTTGKKKPAEDTAGGDGMALLAGAEAASILPQTARAVKPQSLVVSLEDWESQWGEERFEFVDDLYPLRFDMSGADLQALAGRVAGLVAAHDSLACHHLQAVSRYRRMGDELRRLVDGQEHDEGNGP